jgi:hypothetical protein
MLSKWNSFVPDIYHNCTFKNIQIFTRLAFSLSFSSKCAHVCVFICICVCGKFCTFFLKLKNFKFLNKIPFHECQVLKRKGLSFEAGLYTGGFQALSIWRYRSQIMGSPCLRSRKFCVASSGNNLWET